MKNSSWAASIVYNELTAKYSLFYAYNGNPPIKGYYLSGTTWNDINVSGLYENNTFATTNYKDVYFLGQDTYETLADIYSVIETPFRNTMNISAVRTPTDCALTFSQRGVGNKVAVFIKSGSYTAPLTADGTTYTADAAFGSGTELGSSGWYCIYNGVGQTVTVTGLTATTTYQVQALEYNGDAGSTNTQMYIGNAAVTGNPISFGPVPTITSFTPTSALTGATVTISGTDFTGATVVSFGGTVASTYTVTNPTTITATVGSGTSGSVSVTSPGGTATKTGFTYIPPAPVISSFTPTSAGSGTTVTITGTNFTGATVVSFGGTTASAYTVTNSTTITAAVGSGTTGSVSVTTPGGTATLAGLSLIHISEPTRPY